MKKKNNQHLAPSLKPTPASNWINLEATTYNTTKKTLSNHAIGRY